MMRQVPWENWQQWHHLRCCFFSSSPARIAEALDRVSAWQSRGDLPMAVEITAELISIQQRDACISTDVSPSIALPGEMLRMMYAMAIMRLVNGLVEQPIRRNTSSVANRAEDARLPRVFVDIRHETAHNELPSLPLVRHASKQALAWLQRNYWEEQGQLLPDTQDTLKAKLIEHAQLIYEILVTQQRLLSKEIRRQDYKLQRLTLKHALKGIKRQQQALLRELLELTDSGTSELVSLLVKQELLFHDLNPSCSSPAPSIESPNHQNNSDFGGVPDSSSGDDVGSTVRQEDNSVAAWRHTCVQLAEHMPQLPIMLLTSIVEILTAMSCESSSKIDLKENLTSSFFKEGLVEWAAWILDESSALSKKKKTQSGLPKFIETGANVQMHVEFPQDTLKEIALTCVRSRMDKGSLIKLISHLSPLLNDSSFRRRAELLAGCSIECINEENMKDQEFGVKIEENGRNFVVQHHESNSCERNEAREGFVFDTPLVKARELHQMSVAKYVTSLKALECSNSTKSSITAGLWPKVKNWTPSALGNETAIPHFDFKQKASTPVEVDHTEAQSGSAHEIQHVGPNLSTVFSDRFNGQNLKRKASDAQTEDTPAIDPKRKRVEDQLMSEEEGRIVGHAESIGPTDEARGMECEGELIEPMDEDQMFFDIGGAGRFEGSIDCAMEPRPPSIISEPEEVNVAWQGYLLQSGILQLGALQELPNLQAAIRVL